MALKADLEAREAECQSVLDYCNLALEAIADPKDEEYAKSLLDQAEGDASMPPDYIAIAEVAAKMGNKDYAEEMYEEAEDNCFDAMEFAALGHSIAVNTDDKDKAKEMLENAANDAKKINEILTISKYVQDDLGDADLAKSLLDKVVGQCKSIADYKGLAEQLVKDGDTETAKDFFKKGENQVDEIDEAVEYAEVVHELFKDTAWASEVLEDVEDDAQFTKDFVALAKGFMTFAGDKEKAEEMMDQAKDFAMSGEENIALANGFWNLFQNKEAAAESYEKGMSDINDKEQLLGYAKQIGKDMGDKTLAKKFYERAESKMKSAKDLTALAFAVITDTGDKDYASEIYGRAEGSLEIASDLMMLAKQIIENLDDKARAKSIYQNTLTKIEKFPIYLELLGEVVANLDDKDFCKEILVATNEVAATTPEKIQVGKKIVEVIGDKEFAAEVLTVAEEIVTTLDEMKAINAEVKAVYADDAEWIKRVDVKLQKREENNDLYDVYQKREEKANTLKLVLGITDEMMAELNDPYYARKLLKAAGNMIDAEVFNVDKYRKLMRSIKTHLDDDEWIVKILNYAVSAKVAFHFDLVTACQFAIEEVGNKELALGYLKDWEAKIDANDNKAIYDYTKLAGAVAQLAGDKAWAMEVLGKGEAMGGSYLEVIQAANVANLCGDASRANSILQGASATCETANDFFKLAKHAQTLGFDEAAAKSLYTGGKSKMSTPMEKLNYAEGIVELFYDKAWASNVYGEIASAFSTEGMKEIYDESKMRKLEEKYF
jgi:hypothetical protein